MKTDSSSSSTSKKGVFRRGAWLSNRNLIFLRFKSYDVDEIESNPSLSLFPFITFLISSFVAPISTSPSSLEVFSEEFAFTWQTWSARRVPRAMAGNIGRSSRECALRVLEGVEQLFHQRGMHTRRSPGVSHVYARESNNFPSYLSLGVPARVRSGFDLLNEYSILIELC